MNEAQNKLHMTLWSAGVGIFLGSSIMFGYELGLFTALAQQPCTAEQMATDLNLDIRYTVEWCIHMYSNGIIARNNDTQTYYMTHEQQNALLNENSAQYEFGLIQLSYGCMQLHPAVLKQWKSINTKNNGVDWNDFNDNVIHGIKRWSNVSYQHLLCQYWIPCIDSTVIQQCHTGADVYIADVGCGLGSSTIQFAKYFSNATVIGYDYDPKSLEAATQLAQQDNLNNSRFEQSDAESFKLPHGKQYTLIFFLTAFHDMSNPTKIIQHCKSILSPDGAVILVEPYAADTLEQTCQHPATQLLAGASLHYCTGCAKNYTTDGIIMGAVPPNLVYEKLWIDQGGFKTMRMLKPENTPTNRLFEIRL